MLSLVTSVCLSIRIKLFKWKTERENQNVTLHPRSKLFWLFSIKSNSVVDVAQNWSPIVLLFLAGSLQLPKNKLKLEYLNQYPHCLMEYFHTLLRPVLTSFLFASSQLIRNKEARKAIIKEAKLLIDKLTNRNY